MSFIELFFLDLGLGYSSSKVMSYAFFPFLGLILFLLLRKKFKRKLVKWSFFILSIGLPFTLYFIKHPIYQGDFSNNSEPIQKAGELDEVKRTKLVVVSIADCPFCYQSVGRMLDLKKRHPKVDIEYRVCASDSIVGEAIENYKKIPSNNLTFLPAKNGDSLGYLVNMSFPTFVLIEGKSKKMWSNDNFGVGALDEVVEAFEK